VVEPEGRGEEVILPMTRDAAVQIALLLLAGALLFAGLAFFRWYRRRPWLRTGISAGLMGALSAAAFVLAFTVAVNVPTYPVPFTARFATNPTPNTPETTAAGKAVYERLCLVCHGARGAGDGPAAFTMNPRPLDLRIHVPLHAEGEHFHWISEGIPGTAMPGWRANLSDTERWQLVRYIQSLAATP
jgi:copper transport protein